MDPSVFVVADLRWLHFHGTHSKRLAQALCPIGRSAAHLVDGCNLLVKFRNQSGAIVIDDEARLKLIGDDYYVRSERLCALIRAHPPGDGCLALFFEGTTTEARCVATFWDQAFLRSANEFDPTMRLESYDVPPATVTIVDAERPLGALYRIASSRDSELFAVYASRFLDAPHIITALFSHVFTIRTDDNIRFPIQVKKLAEQLRVLLTTTGASVQVGAVTKSHVDLWAQVQGQRFAFLDGGVARIPALAGVQPASMRVGVYSVRPGIVAPDEREQWMTPFVLGDLIDRTRPTQERPDTRRFHEAARYTLEPLSGLQHLREFADTRLLLMHGPLINQFVQYDEGEPNFLPFIEPSFLKEAGIDETGVCSAIPKLPHDSAGRPMWNQFIAIYGYVMKAVDECATPIAGVVERPTGRAVTTAVLARLQKDGLITAAYVDRVTKELERYDITDDFLFGCVLRAGEYITPVQIQKNYPHRARERWQPVVRHFPQPHAFLLKTEDMNFPFRVEMNRAAAADVGFAARFLYHTARLLPRYAFPVGLDIVDKYAKIPDWISRGVSAEMSAAVLRRALKTGDAHVVMQIRLLLTRGPRDFFFRPSAGVH
jgi:hypothetical protein